jgi:WD40 repeat protein
VDGRQLCAREQEHRRHVLPLSLSLSQRKAHRFFSRSNFVSSDIFCILRLISGCGVMRWETPRRANIVHHTHFTHRVLHRRRYGGNGSSAHGGASSSASSSSTCSHGGSACGSQRGGARVKVGKFDKTNQAKMEPATEVLHEHRDLIHDVAFDFYGSRMATCSSDQTIKIFDKCDPPVEGKGWRKSAEFRVRVCLCVSVPMPAIRLSLDGHHEKCFHKMISLRSCQAHNGAVWRICWAHPEFGQILASCSLDHCVTIWEESMIPATLYGRADKVDY